MTITPEQIAALSAPFPIPAHTVREGFRNSGKTKIRWFVYVDVREVQQRLETIFPGGWGTTKPDIIPFPGGVIASIGISINGETRWYTGGQDSDVDYTTKQPVMSADDAKGAVTDSIRRAASLWGVAEYIYSMDLEIWTASYDKGDWEAQKRLKAEALATFTSWYNRQFKTQAATPPTAPKQQTQQPAQQPQQPIIDKSTGEITTTEPEWFNKPVGQAWKQLHPYLLEHIYKGNDFGKEKSMQYHAKLTKAWQGMTAKDVVKYLETRHDKPVEEQSPNPYSVDPAYEAIPSANKQPA